MRLFSVAVAGARLRFAAAALVGLLSLLAAGGRPAAAQLFVSSATADTIYRFDAAGNATVFASGGLLTDPRGIAFDVLGNVYVANGSGNNILRFNPDGSGGIVFYTGTLSTPNDLVFGPDGNLYVTNALGSTAGVQRISATGASLGRYGPAISTLRGLDFAPNGDLIVSESASAPDSLIRLSPPSGTQTTFSTTSVENPREIEFAPDGTLVVVNNGYTTPTVVPATVRRYDASGTLLATLPANGISNPQGLAIGPDGTIYVINNAAGAGNIRRYSSAGTALSAWTAPATPFGAAFFVASAAVAPESGTMALLGAVGLPLLIGAVVRRWREA